MNLPEKDRMASAKEGKTWPLWRDFSVLFKVISGKKCRG